MGFIGLAAPAADQVQPAAVEARPTAESGMSTANAGAPAAKAVPAVQVDMKSGSVVPMLTVNQPGGQPLFSLKPYGYVKIDASYDTQRAQPGDYAFYVLPKVNGKSDNEFNMTARETRIGLELAGPDTEDLKTAGRIEVDFYGGGSANSANLRMRLGYLDLKHSSGFSVRAGQDWETFVTAIPRMLNIALLNDSGQVGLRRPQVRLSQEIPVGSKSKFVAKVAAARTIGQDLDGGGQDDGADSGVPTFQYNALFETPLLAEKTSAFSFSGLVGRETLDASSSNKVVSADHESYTPWLMMGSAVAPLHRALTLQGTLWTGSALAAYYGGIGQGINTTRQTTIDARGFWVQAMADLTQKLNWNLGYGVDDPDDSDLNKGDRARNSTVFTSVYYRLTSAVTAAFEYSYITTAYLGAGDASDNRFQGSMIYKF